MASAKIKIILFGWYFFFFFFRFYLFFLERGGEGEREGEKHQCVVASCAPPTGDWAHIPGMCPDWESNRRPFNSQASTLPLSHTSQGWMLFLYKDAYSSIILLEIILKMLSTLSYQHKG